MQLQRACVGVIGSVGIGGVGSVVVVVGGGVDVAVVVASEASDAARGGTTASHRFIDRRAGVPTREEKAVDAVTVDIAGMDEMI